MSVLETAPLARADDLPPLRLLPVPPCEPPYDDELPTPPPPPVAIGPLLGLAPLRLVPDLGDDEEAVAPRTPTEDLPPARPVAQALVQGLLEVLAGARPVSQLQRRTTPELFARLEQELHGRPRAVGTSALTGAVRSLHVQQRPDGVAEVCATVRRGRRMGALALRLEGRSGAWYCSDVAGI